MPIHQGFLGRNFKLGPTFGLVIKKLPTPRNKSQEETSPCHILPSPDPTVIHLSGRKISAGGALSQLGTWGGGCFQHSVLSVFSCLLIYLYLPCELASFKLHPPYRHLKKEVRGSSWFFFSHRRWILISVQNNYQDREPLEWYIIFLPASFSSLIVSAT